MNLIIDLQILQTPARFRGMGQYVVSLFEALNVEASDLGSVEISIILTTGLPVKKELIKKIKSILPSGNIVELPLVTLNQETNTKKAYSENRKIIENWIQDNDIVESIFCIPALFQAEIYPVFPVDSRKCLLAYDIIPLQMPGRYAPTMRWDDYLYRYSELYSADTLFCISQTTSNALQVYSGVPSDKLVVINGGPASFPKAKIPKNKINSKYVLMPTGNDLRKNNENAIKGFELFNQSSERGYKLVITSVFSDQEIKKLSELSSSVIFTGNVEDEELSWLYENSVAVLFPSVLEGLGMPLLEGMVCGKPIVASHIDVFEEISEDVPYYFNPYDPTSISQALTTSLNDPSFSARNAKYKKILATYSWIESAKTMMSSLVSLNTKEKKEYEKKKIAILCPIPSGISAVGKVVAEMHPILSEYADIDYYFELPTLNKELRPDLLSAIAPNKHVTHFNRKRYESYDRVIYHLGNGNHHSITTTHALTMPGTVILHDLNLEGVFDDLLKKNIIDQNRYNLEIELNERSGNKCKFITTVINNQKSVIVHSGYSENIVKGIISSNNSVKIVKADLATHTPNYLLDNEQKNGQFKIGLAGILANIKGLKVIEDIARNPLFKHDKILLFGLNFAEAGALDRLRALPNVSVETDLSDYAFQEKLKDLSVFINFRTHYQGEASSATIEAMRYGVPVVVRSDFGWYSELPDDSVIKVDKESEIAQTILKYREDREALGVIGENARKFTKNTSSPEKYAQKIIEAIGNKDD